MHFLAEIGVILLMFLAGLEANLELLRKYFKPSLVVAISGVVIPMVTFYYVGITLGFPINTAVFMGSFLQQQVYRLLWKYCKSTKRYERKLGQLF